MNKKFDKLAKNIEKKIETIKTIDDSIGYKGQNLVDNCDTKNSEEIHYTTWSFRFNERTHNKMDSFCEKHYNRSALELITDFVNNIEKMSKKHEIQLKYAEIPNLDFLVDDDVLDSWRDDLSNRMNRAEFESFE